jgi:hypothetical protein
MGRQEFIERRPRTEAEQPPEFWPGQMTGLVFFERQCFERAALEIGDGAEALDEVVGYSDSDIHADNVSPRGLPVHHLPARRAVIRAYNIVSADYFKGLGDRLTPAAIIPMHTPEEAIAELEFITKPLGSKVGMFGSNMARKVPAAAANDPDTAAALRERGGRPDPEQAYLTGNVENIDDFAACRITRKEAAAVLAA